MSREFRLNEAMNTLEEVLVMDHLARMAAQAQIKQMERS
jgi:hypothetical protein